MRPVPLLKALFEGTHTSTERKSQEGEDSGIPPLTKNVKDGAPGSLTWNCPEVGQPATDKVTVVGSCTLTWNCQKGGPARHDAPGSWFPHFETAKDGALSLGIVQRVRQPA
jgi:hypothetical protein